MIGILLSIIIPVYNVADYVGKTLTSLEEQTNKNFELIIVDDGSIDSSLEVVRERLQTGNISRYSIIEQENAGVSVARNRGFEKAEGEYVLFLDGDDYVGSNLVERLSTVTRECSPDIICWGFDKVLKDGKSIDGYSLKYRNKPEVMMTGLEALTNMVVKKNMHIWTASAAYKREFITKIGLQYTPGCKCGEDLEFTYKALSRADSVLHLRDTLSYYVQRPSSISNIFKIDRFDAVFAMTRVSEYISKFVTAEYDFLVELFKLDKTVGTYMGTFHQCLRALKAEGFSMRSSLKRLKSELELGYPGLYNEMEDIMRSYPWDFSVLSIRMKVFLFSPILYDRIMSIVKLVR